MKQKIIKYSIVIILAIVILPNAWSYYRYVQSPADTFYNASKDGIAKFNAMVKYEKAVTKADYYRLVYPEYWERMGRVFSNDWVKIEYTDGVIDSTPSSIYVFHGYTFVDNYLKVKYGGVTLLLVIALIYNNTGFKIRKKIG